MSKFTELRTTRKGTSGEAIARAYFINKGYKPYAPDFDGPHPIDFLVFNPKKGSLTAIDVKTYPRRYVAAQTGIDTADYNSYKAFEDQHDIKVFIIWVDAFERAIYGAYLSDLGNPVATTTGKVYFGLERVQLLKRLSVNEVENANLSVSSLTKYRNVLPFFSSSSMN